MPSFKIIGLSESQVTPQEIFRNRRRLVVAYAMATGTQCLTQNAFPAQRLMIGENGVGSEATTPLELIKNYINYYEFSNDKKASKVLAQELTLHPWKITIDGEVEKPYTLDIDDIAKLFPIEERIYRFRCVEGWSMVVPWMGFSLGNLIERARPTSRAKFVSFESLNRSSEMVGQRTGNLIRPYLEGLRIDEAMHPLTFAVTGLYGQSLPKQNGAPLRIIIPWKYGFKNPKAIVRINLVASQPLTSWSMLAPSEYGFYGNVNPKVPHPRWSQARENRIGEIQKHPTLMLNGYADQVAHLYSTIDAKALY